MCQRTFEHTVKLPYMKKENDKLLHNGVNIKGIYGSNLYSFGLNLMDALFDKEEMSKSLLVTSKKSDKPGLDETKVKKLFEMNEEKFKDNEAYKKDWNSRTFINKANQKCRDAIRVVKKKDRKLMYTVIS